MKQTLFALTLSAAIAGTSGCDPQLEPLVWEGTVTGVVVKFTDFTLTTTVPVEGATVYRVPSDEQCDRNGLLGSLCDLGAVGGIMTDAAGSYSFTLTDPDECEYLVGASFDTGEPRQDGGTVVLRALPVEMAPTCCPCVLTGPTLIVR